MTNCTRFIQFSTWYDTTLLRATWLEKIKQLMKAWLPLRVDLFMYNIYLPKQPREELGVDIPVMRITAYLHHFEVYLGQQQNSAFGRGYDVVMKLCKDISRKNNHIYFDNLFTFVQLLNVLLTCKTSCNGTIWLNKKCLPNGIHKPGRLIQWCLKSYQDGSSNLVVTVWQDNRIVRLITTNSNPRNVVHADSRLGHNVIQVNQPQSIQLYNR